MKASLRHIKQYRKQNQAGQTGLPDDSFAPAHYRYIMADHNKSQNGTLEAKK